MSGKIHVFNVLYNLRNSARFHPQNAWNRISGTLDFKIFPEAFLPGAFPPDPPRRSHAFGVSFAHPKVKVWLRHWPETEQSLSKGPVYTIKFSFKDIVTRPY
jgi:hypothetical protein